MLFIKTQLLFSGFEGESDSTCAKQQMEVVRCEITHCHGRVYAFLLFQGKVVTWRNLQLKILDCAYCAGFLNCCV